MTNTPFHGARCSSYPDCTGIPRCGLGCTKEMERSEASTRPANWIDQNYQIDRYGVALMMIREGCADPAGLARRILSEFGSDVGGAR